MNYSTRLNMVFCLTLLLSVTACGGGGGGGNDNPTTSSSTKSSATTNSSSLTSSSQSSSSNSISSSSSSSSSTSIIATSCAVNGTNWPVCVNDNGSWNFQNNQYCISQSFCPVQRTNLPNVTTRTTPVDTNANAKTKRIYNYLKSVWGQKTLAAQQDLTWKDSIDMAARIHTDTGKYPAMMGYDFMNYGMTASWVEGLDQTNEAITYANDGGLVTFSWHWRDPALLGTSNVNNAQFYANQSDTSKNTNFMIPVKDGVLDQSTDAYTQINAGIDLIAVELKKLNDAGVTVLWRPLHEASGNNGNGWFWWGRSRSDGVPQAYANILLWRHIYDRLVNYHQLHNLLWIWNGQNPVWYPGDDTVDIMSQDIYDSIDNKTYKSQIASYTATRKYTSESKMIAMSENSFIPDPDKISTDGAWWLWFMVWNDSDTAAGVTDANNFWTGEYYNTNVHKTKVYNHANVITLDELPDFDAE
jgi:mannan endo-1,4-beta-mannosidase